MTKSKPVTMRNRIFSFVSAGIIALNSIPIMNLTTANAANSATNSDSVFFPVVSSNNESAKLYHDDSLVDNGDGTFTFTSNITSAYSYSDTSESRLRSKDGEYKLDKAGKYLIEVWGGDGGDGGRGFLTGRSGIGGQGGFVYGILEVSAENELLGKKLVYEIGSKGESETFDVSGGGTGGDGGGAGDITFVSVGAGGGYSAVYLVDADDNRMTTEDKNTASTAEDHKLRDTTNNVLMIAGGGGGGAAGANGFHLTALILKMHGDGGDGGSFDSAISAEPSIGNFTTGTYFAGENGTSSGGKTSYVGQGGTDRPEGLAKTTIGYMTASTYANDWQMTYHPELGRGVGGAGNLHGGGGGAGFAGGGGGIQNVILDANNVGGGGGASSYIMAENGYFKQKNGDVDQNIIDNYLVPKDVKRENGGGAVYITYLEDDASYYNYLGNVTISGEVSQYFDIDKSKSSCKNLKYDAQYNEVVQSVSIDQYDTDNLNKIRIIGSIAPEPNGLKKGQAHDTLTLTLRLKPKAAFAGGNNVPIFALDSGNTKATFNCKATNDDAKTCTLEYWNDYNTPSEGDSLTEQQEKEKKNKTYEVSHVNVPLNLNLRVNNLIKSPTEFYVPTDLYAVGAVSPNALISNAPNGFITSVDTTSVSNFSEPPTITLTDADLNKTKTHDITVSVTLSDEGTHAVGDPCETTFTRTATVKCVAQGTLYVDGFEIKPKKSLSYNSTDQTYDFDVDLKVKLQDTSKKQLEAYAPQNEQSWTYTSNQTNVKFTAGVYFIEAWGGDGGNNQYVLGLDANNYANGGIGGKGDFESGYYQSSSDFYLDITIGQKGANGNSSTNNRYVTAGNKGTATIINVVSGSNLITAGGGGGGSTPYTLKENGRFYPGVYGENGGENSLTNSYDGEDGYTAKQNELDSIPSHAKSGYSSNALLNSFTDNKLIDVSPTEVTIERTNPIRTWVGTPGMFGTSWDCTEGTEDRSVSYNTTVPKSTLEGRSGGGYVKITRLGLKGYIGSDSYLTLAAYNEALPTKTRAMENTMESFYTTNGFTIGETFSQYFEVVGNCEKTPSSENLSITTTVVDGRLDCKLKVTSTTSALVTTATTQTSTSPVAGYSVNKTIYSYGLRDVDIGVRVHLNPQDDFLGGNDVELLDEDTNKPANGSTTAVKVEHSGTTTPDTSDDVGYVLPNELTDYANVEIDNSDVTWTLSKGSDIYVPYDTAVDTSAADIISTFFRATASDPTSDLAAAEEWKAEYVEWGGVSCEPDLPDNIIQDTSYTLRATLAPKDTAPDAVVREKMPAKDTNVVVNVHVQYKVSIDPLSKGIECDKDGAAFTKDDIEEDLVIKITPAAGYKFPLSSTDNSLFDVENIITNVSGIEDQENGDHSYSLESCKDDNCIYLRISEANIDKIYQNIVITGTAVPNTNKLYYLYEVYDSNDSYEPIKTVKVEGGEFGVGDDITGISLPFDPDPEQESDKFPTGYDGYLWSWGDGTRYVDVPERKMGASDMYLLGRYLEKTYTLTINYLYAGDATPFKVYTFPPYTRYNEETGIYEMALKAGSQYYVISPQVEGYIPNIPVVAGTVEGNDNPDPVDVTYIPTSASLIIYQIKCDAYGVPTEEVPEGVNRVVYNAADVISSDDYEIIQYTQFKKIIPEAPAEPYYVEEEVDRIGTTGVYYVYYRSKLNRVTIHFNEVKEGTPGQPAPADVAIGVKSDPPNRIQVAAGREYSYDPDTDTYKGLPRAVCDNYLFDGWYTATGELVSDDDIVPDTDVTIELYAHWKSDQVTITVDYKYAYSVNPDSGEPIDTNLIEIGDKVNHVSQLFTYGKSYNFTSPTLIGYALADDKQEVIKGIALEDDSFIVYYKNSPVAPENITYTINVYSSAFKGDNDAPTSNAPKVTGGTLKLTIGSTEYSIENRDGTITLNNTEYPIAEGDYSFVFEPTSGYAVKHGKITVSNEGVYNIFLDKSPFQLPMAGGKPLTGYTVCGISTMLLAAFLLFLYVSSKSEENENE